MKLVLKETVEKLGEAGDIVTVKDGYGRNYLIPRGKAAVATQGAVRAVEERQRQLEKRFSLDRQAAEELAGKIKETSITIPVTAGEEGKIHGTITTMQIARALAEKGIQIDRRKVTLNEEVRSLGEYTADVQLHGDITAGLKVWVVKDES